MNELVTVIVPVYNVEQYIDRCVESIVNQTYRNLEILLINDGSTDNSLEKCIEWKNRDDRIIVIDKHNEKQGPTRDYGIHIARGSYITCIDSDDWISNQYVERLLYVALSSDSDMVVCNYRIYVENIKSQRRVGGIFSKAILETEIEKIRYMKERPLTAFWGKLFRRSMLIDNQIKQPATTAQDLAVLVQTIACAKKIALIPDSLYFYWDDRADSITNSVKQFRYYPYVLRYSVAKMKQLNLFEKYQEGQLAILYFHFSAMMKRITDKDEKCAFKSEVENLLDETFPQWKQKVGMSWWVNGSFNARWIAQAYSQSYLCTPNHYTFSSLISQFLGNKNISYTVSHKNPFREKMVVYDIKGSAAEENVVDEAGVLIDFLDECNDIIETQDGVYITNSEAYQECEKEGIVVKRTISFGTQEHMELWERACLRFIEHLRNNEKETKIYLLKMRLAEGYGWGKEEKIFDNCVEVSKSNEMLEKMDCFFMKNCLEAIYIEGEDNLYYAQIDNAFGTKPSHLNWELYMNMKEKLKELR